MESLQRDRAALQAKLAATVQRLELALQQSDAKGSAQEVQAGGAPPLEPDMNGEPPGQIPRRPPLRLPPPRGTCNFPCGLRSYVLCFLYRRDMLCHHLPGIAASLAEVWQSPVIHGAECPAASAQGRVEPGPIEAVPVDVIPFF